MPVSSLGGLDLNAIDALGALLKERNLTHAGALIGASQPAMSVLLGRLRRHFGDELLVRHGREYHLTPLARELLPVVQTAVGLVRQTLRLEPDFDPTRADRVFTIAASDYTTALLTAPLLRRLDNEAAGVRVEFIDIPIDFPSGPEVMLRFDLAIVPLGMGAHGAHRFLFRDRIVCLLDRHNPAARDGTVSLEDYHRLPHLSPLFPGSPSTAMERWLDEGGAERRHLLTAHGFLPLVYALAGTDAVALVPERLARRVAGNRLRIVEPPFRVADMLEAMHWHPCREGDAAHDWLLGVIGETVP